MWESGVVCRIPKGLREQGKTCLWFSAGFHNPAISTALCPGLDSCYRILGTPGDSILQVRSTFAFAAPIFFANSVSLIAAAF
jgi:hypothetical protein